MHYNRNKASAGFAGTTAVTGTVPALSVQAAGPTVTTQQTGYDTLLSVHQVAPEKFKTEDKESFLKYWDAVFLSNTTCEDNYNAIASMSTTATGVAQAEKVSTKAAK